MLFWRQFARKFIFPAPKPTYTTHLDVAFAACFVQNSSFYAESAESDAFFGLAEFGGSSR